MLIQHKSTAVSHTARNSSIEVIQNDDINLDNERQAPSTAKQSNLADSPKLKVFFDGVNKINFSSLTSKPFQNEIAKRKESPNRT